MTIRCKTKAKLKSQTSTHLPLPMLDHRTRLLRHPTPQSPPKLMPESTECCQQHNSKRSGSANPPKITFGFHRIHNVAKVHAVIAGEEGKREKDDGDNGKKP